MKDNTLENIEELLDIFEQNIKTIMNGLQDFVASDDARDEKLAEKKQGDPDVLLKLLQDLEPYVKKNRPEPCNNVMAEIRKFAWPDELYERYFPP